MLNKIFATGLSFLVLSTSALAARYDVDPVHSQVHFTIPHLVMFKVRGTFTDMSGQVEVDTTKQTITAVQGTVKSASIDTRESKRDEHLRSPDFFDTAQYPEITFVSKKITGKGSKITVVGDLTIHGVTKSVELKGSYLGANKDPWGNERTGFEATGKINRKDFGLTWNKALETGGFVVGDEVQIGLEIEAVKQK
ncbi:MAG: polyisoprenoid-binding protein [SAR324 cluster bacterium]|nr:polyisoprenoid-binding protein [SAR324 cluster bacterium]